MMPTVNGVMLAIGSSLVASIVAKVTVTTALGLAAAWLARGNRAAIRHALLAATFGVMLLLPIVSVVMPPLHVGVPIQVESRAALLPLVMGFDAGRSVPAAGAGSGVTPAAPQVSKLSLSGLLLAGWAAGVALFLLPVLVGLWQIRSLRRSGLPWRSGQSVVEALAPDTGIHRRVEVLLHEALPGPMTCGIVRPAIVLPRDAESWTLEDLNRAIVHELEHVRRGDSVSRCLARVAGAVYWFHPLVWIAWRRLVLEAERSCDDAVLKRSDATAYADQLVGLAKRLSMTQGSPIVAMANRADLATRVGAVLDSRQQRGRAGTISLALACAAMVALVLVMSPLTVVAAPQAQSRPKFEVASIKPSRSAAGSYFARTPGSLTATNSELSSLLEMAYQTRSIDLSRVPASLRSERFDIVAKASGKVSGDQYWEMLQVLLEDRFKVIYHRETKDAQVYALIVDQKALAKKGMNLGPKLSRSKDPDCPLNPDGTNFCGVNPRPGMMIGQRVSMARISREMSAFAGRPVQDETGLTGSFDFQLTWTLGQVSKEDGDKITAEAARLGAAGQPASDPSGPSFFSAVQEQLGLKLESKQGRVETLVIDHAERPSEN